MKAIVITQTQDLTLKDWAIPACGKDEILIDVHASGINRPDVLQRKGHYPPPPGVTEIPGLEIAGIRHDTGEAVCALLPGGGYAAIAAAHKELCLPIPKGWSMDEAATLPEALFTVWKNVFVIGGLRAGETFLLNGGSSGIGSYAIQMAKAAGAKVISCSRGVRKAEWCKALGADMAIDTTKTTLDPEHHKADVILDMVGGDLLDTHARLLNFKGRHVSIAFQGGGQGTIPIMPVMKKQLLFTGSTLRASPIDEKIKLAQDLRHTVWPWLENGLVKPVLTKRFAFEDARAAQDWLDHPDHRGKIILKNAGQNE